MNQLLLPPADVVPRTELVANSLEYANLPEAQGLDKTHACRVGKCYPADSLHEALEGDHLQQRSDSKTCQGYTSRVWEMRQAISAVSGGSFSKGIADPSTIGW